MKTKEAFRQFEKFLHSISSLHPELLYEIVQSWKGPFRDWFRKEVPANGYSKKSGVYIFSSIESDILYIGKAAANNFGSEIYGKFGSASTVDENDRPYFGKSSSIAEFAPDGYAEYFLNGDLYISGLCFPKRVCITA